MEKLAAIRIYDGQNYSDEIPISALAENIEWNGSGTTLIDILGSVDITNKGNIQDQIDQLNIRINQAYNKPINGIPKTDLANSVQVSLEKADTAQVLKINKPVTNPNGTQGQILQTDGQGGTTWVNKQTDEQIAEAVSDWLDDHVTPGSGALIVDDTLTITGAAADAKKVGDEISDLKDDLSDIDGRVTALEQSGGSGLTSNIKQALLQLAAKVAYVDDDGQDYYDDLHDALYTLVSISAVYTQSGMVYPTSSLDSLKSDLVVTALYDDQSTATITTYTLSGTLTVGTSTITVSYGGKTTTFTVTVTEGESENFVEVNSPVIENKILKKSSTNTGYIRTDEVFSPGSSSWNIKFKFKKISASGTDAYQDLVDTVDSSNSHIRSLLYEIVGTNIKQYLAESGASSWNINAGGYGSASISNDTEYYLDAYFNGSKYGLKISTDGETWTDFSMNSAKVIAGGGYLAFGRPANGNLNGEIDLSTLEIWIDDEQWWVAYGSPRALSSISAVYTQSSTVYTTTPLNSLKDDLVVTAIYDDQSTKTVTNYTLSGTLTEGTSTVTVTYEGKTTTFTVTVSAPTWTTGYDTVGTPSISGNEYTPSANGYIKTPQVFDPGNDSWELRFKVTRSSGSGFQNIFRAIDSNANLKRAIFIQANGNEHKVYIASTDDSTDIVNGSSFTLAANNTAYVAVAYDGTNSYTAKTSTDGTTWTTVFTVTSASKIKGGYYIEFGGALQSGTSAYAGILYLDELQISIDGSIWWKAV